MQNQAYNFCSYILSLTDLVVWLDAWGLFFGLICVILLIKRNIWTWPTGIIYVLISLYLFATERLYADFLLHLVFLGMNIFGWYYWLRGNQEQARQKLRISTSSASMLLYLVCVGASLTIIGGYVFSVYTDADLPYWDNFTTMFSFIAIWLTARKNITSWYFWLVVDVVATGVYWSKGIYFYSILYAVYIVLAILGFKAWQKTFLAQQ